MTQISPKSADTKQDQLNRMNPAARDAQLGDVVADLIANYNKLLADVTALRTAYGASGAAPAITAEAVAGLDQR